MNDHGTLLAEPSVAPPPIRIAVTHSLSDPDPNAR